MTHRMSDPRKGKSIWKRFDKPKGESKVESDGKLYYRINRKTGRIETNLLEWERSWKNVKILKYPTRFANELRLGVRDNHGLDQILQANVILPEVDTAREYWIPTIEEQAALNAIEDEAARTLLSNQLFLILRQGRLDENARRKALNEVAKTRIDLEVKDLKERGDTVNKIMGQILEDMTKTKRTLMRSRMRRRLRTSRKLEKEEIGSLSSKRRERPTCFKVSLQTAF